MKQEAKVTYEPMRHNYTAQESLELADETSRAIDAKREAEEQLKSVQATYKERITTADAAINSANRKRTTGYEIKDTPVLHLKHRPQAGDMMLVRLDTGRIWKIRGLREEESQMTITDTEPPAMIFTGILHDESTPPITYSVNITRDEYEKLKPFAEEMMLEPMRMQLSAAGEDSE